MIKKNHKLRALFIISVLVLSFLALICKFFYIQIIHHEFYVAQASAIQKLMTTLYPKRGNICDRNKKILALSQPTKIICLNPQIIHNPNQTKSPEQLVEELSRILSIDEQTIARKINLKNKKGEYLKGVFLKRKTSDEEIKQVEALLRRRDFFKETEKNPQTEKENGEECIYQGIFFRNRVKRFYPNGPLLCHILGYMKDEDPPGMVVVRDDLHAVTGIELIANKCLEGKKGWKVNNIDNARREIVPLNPAGQPAVDGNDVVLTIDLNIQFIAEEEVKEAFEAFKCDAISIIVMKPQTGEILALANLPNFDPNDLTNLSNEQQINFAIERMFEPGSTLKAITGSIALDQQAVKLSDQFHCENGAWHITRRFTLHDAHSYEILSFYDVIVKSSNIGIAKVAKLLGKELFYAYLKNFGFGTQTNICLQGEISGILRRPEHWSGYSIYEIPMGQEIAVTPLQLALAFSVIANGGDLMKPMVIKEILDKEGEVIKTFEPKVVRRVISEEAAKEIIKALKDVVSEEGTAPKADIKGFTEAGKTGTAQRVIDGTYSKTNFDSTFVGFAPADNPQIVILVTMFNTVKPYHFGGTVAAPVFSRVGERVLKYLEIEPDGL